MSPLHGFRIIEIAGIGPGPFCGMLLADLGANLIRIERPGGPAAGVRIPDQYNVLLRGRPAIEVDLKSSAGVELVLELCNKADALFEGFRPGVMEDLGLGPDECMGVNPKLVYGRITGWGQEGPLAQAAGHDGNYASLVGAIAAIGDKDGPPVVPLNLVGDYGGGAAYLAIGILAALLDAHRSGKGQVVDAAMVDGAASLMSLFYGLNAGGLWHDERGSNMLDGGAPFYRPYETKDGKYIFVAAIEPRFYQQLLENADIADLDPAGQFDRSTWQLQEETFRNAFATKTRREWTERFDGTDACVSPVLSLTEAPEHPHNKARQTFVEIDGVIQPAPAPRFSRTPGQVTESEKERTTGKVDSLREWGLTQSEIDERLGPDRR
jgi:alpha-methylacyl-CoA racemase